MPVDYHHLDCIASSSLEAMVEARQRHCGVAHVYAADSTSSRKHGSDAAPWSKRLSRTRPYPDGPVTYGKMRGCDVL